MQHEITRGIVLMNLGSPDSTQVKDVRKYLNEFLMDKRVIDMPYLFRLLLVKGIIVPFRSPKSAAAYRSIWTNEGSPLISISKKLKELLEKRISEPVSIAMRYGNPSPQKAYEELMKKNPGLQEVTLFPLYPHYAMSSYETAVEYAKFVHKKYNFPFELNIIKPYYYNPNYLYALKESIRPYLQEYDHLLFSYHGVPRRHISKGDITSQHCLKIENCCEVSSIAHRQCYRHQCLLTSFYIGDALAISKEKYSISFQSRLGREEWLKPYTAERLERMPSEGIKKLLVACPAFVSDCLETLEEIAQEGKEIFIKAGGESFTMIPCLNTNPEWVNAIIKMLKVKES